MNVQKFVLLIIQLGCCLAMCSSALWDISDDRSCSKGPSQWCKNIKTAKTCNAMRHCVQTVWEKQQVPKDDDSICQICLDMVKEARDQLESNETQMELKAVFEGSCHLIPLKPIAKECIRLADDFVPELVEALSSQMNPEVVCSVAGLCNNAKIDKMLKEYKQKEPPVMTTTTTTTTPPSTPKSTEFERRKLSCDECESVAAIASTKFKITNPDDMLDAILNLCGHASSFSDACANIVLTYFSQVSNYIKSSFNPTGFCTFAGTCSSRYHHHRKDETALSTGNTKLNGGDDIACELCQQLVHHLQDVLVANTTELEFKQVAEGLCNQTKSFKTECLSIVDQYYDKIYQALVKDVDANGLCFLIGICPKGDQYFLSRSDIIPLIPYVKPAKIDVTITKKRPVLSTKGLPVYTKQEIDSMQLPIDVLMGPMNPKIESGELCTICQYVLHFLQETLATPATEDKIKEEIEHVCDKIPEAFRGNCHNFVELYGDAIMALVIQGIDPREICPKINLCPGNYNKLEITTIPTAASVPANGQNQSSASPKCPLCLFAVQEAQMLIENNKSKNNVKNVLYGLCTHFNDQLKTECDEFVKTYYNELVDMLVTDFTPQEICVYIKLCQENKHNLQDLANIDVDISEEVSSEMTTDSPIHKIPKKVASMECGICRKMIHEIEKRIINKTSKEIIREALDHVCDEMGMLKSQCHAYIDKYGDQIAYLIYMELEPKIICMELLLCANKALEKRLEDSSGQLAIASKTINTEETNVDFVRDAPPCILCEFIISKLEIELKDKKTQDEIKREVEHICEKMPKTVSEKCERFITKYGDVIISLLETLPPKVICQQMQLCHAMDEQIVKCGVCYGTAMKISSHLSKGDTSQIDLRSLINVGCSDLAPKYHKKCAELLKYYGESIKNLVRENTQDFEICVKIGECLADETINAEFGEAVRGKRDSLVGTNKCTHGPAHWCANRVNAKECGTTAFCEKKIWTNRSSKI